MHLCQTPFSSSLLWCPHLLSQQQVTQPSPLFGVAYVGRKPKRRATCLLLLLLLSLSLSLSLSRAVQHSLSVILSQLSLLYCFCLGLVHINRELTTSHLRFKTKRVSLSSSLSEESWKEFIQLRNGVPSSDCWSLPESYFLNNNRSLFRLQRRLVCVIEGTKQPLSLLLRPCPTRIYSGVVTLSLLLSLSLLLLSLSRRAACQKRR